MFNAAVMFEKAKKPEKAAATYLSMVETYPNSQKSAQAAFTAAQVYESVAYFERAAEAYELVAKKAGRRRNNPYSKFAGDSLFNAGVLRQALGQHKRAITHYQAYAKRFRDRKDAEEVAFRVGVVYEGAGDDGRAERSYRTYLRRYRRGKFAVEASTRSGRTAYRLGQLGRAKRAFKQALAMYKRAKGKERERALEWAAQARYYQGELIFRDYSRIKLDVKPGRLKRTLDKKTNLLTKAQEVYLDVVNFGDPQWAMAALYRIGAVYEGFAVSLREAPAPPGFSKEEKELYRQELDNYVIDVEEKAIEAYTAGYGKALELKVYNEYTKKIRDALGKLAASQFPPERESRGPKRSGDRVPELDMVEEVKR
jgi:TolA-binding protein